MKAAAVLVALGLAGSAFADAPALPAFGLRLQLALIRGAGWDKDAVLDATRRATQILAQCAIRTEAVDLREIEVEPPYRNLDTPRSRELAARLRLATPAVFFVAETRNRPAFDAEAIGRGNSRSRPEMADTVWIASGTRDLPLVIAHELAHVLADSGTHSQAPDNLMRDETAPGATRLTPAQCEAIVTAGARNGLLQRLNR